MAIKIFAILMAIFVIVLCGLSMQDIYLIDFNTQVNTKGMQANNIIAYELNTNKLKSKFEAKQWNKYDDKDELLDFRAFSDNYKLRSDIVNVLDDNNLFVFEGNVDFKDNKQTHIFGDKVYYDLRTKNISSDTNINAFIGEHKINTNTLQYDLNQQTMTSKDVKIWLKR